MVKRHLSYEIFFADTYAFCYKRDPEKSIFLEIRKKVNGIFFSRNNLMTL